MVKSEDAIGQDLGEQKNKKTKRNERVLFNQLFNSFPGNV